MQKESNYSQKETFFHLLKFPVSNSFLDVIEYSIFHKHVLRNMIIFSVVLYEVSGLVLFFLCRYLLHSYSYYDIIDKLYQTPVYELVKLDISFINTIGIVSVLLINFAISLLPGPFLVDKIFSWSHNDGNTLDLLLSYYFLICSLTFYLSLILFILFLANMLILAPLFILFCVLYFVLKTIDNIIVIYSCALVDALFAFLLSGLLSIILYAYSLTNYNILIEFLI